MSEIKKNRVSFCVMRTLVILLFPFLFFLGMILGYLELIPLEVKIHTVIIVTIIFVTFYFFVKHNANYAICHIKGTLPNFQTAMQDALRINSLTIMDKTKSTLDISSYFNEYYQDIRSEQFASVAGSVFPMMGILGTFTAIALSMPDFTVSDVEALDKDISLLLEGIGTAFYASIYGIFLSLVWTFFEKRGALQIDKIVHSLERTYENNVWKESELTKHRHMLTELKDQEIIQTLKETFHMEFVRDLNEHYLKNFTSIVNLTNRSFGELTEKLHIASNELNTTIETIQQKEDGMNAVHLLEKNIATFNDTAKLLSNSIDGFDGTVNRTFVKVDEELANAVDRLTAFVSVINEQNRWMMQEIEKLKEGR